MQINKISTEKLIFILFSIALISLVISFSYSAPGAPSKPCDTQTDVDRLQAKVDELKRTLHECEAEGIVDINSKSQSSQASRNKIQRCEGQIF